MVTEAALPLDPDDRDEKPGQFVLTEAFRLAILRMASAEPFRTRLGVSTLVLIDELLRRGDHAQAARVAIRGRSWRLAAACLRLALARGALSFTGDLADVLGDVPAADLKRDPHLAALAGTLVWTDPRKPERGELLVAAQQGLERTDEEPVSDDHDLLNEQEGPLEAGVWTSTFLMMSRQLLGDLAGAAAAASDAMALLESADAAAIMPVRALFAFAVPLVDLAMTFEGRSSAFATRAFEAHQGALHAEDRALAASTMSLASALRGQMREAERYAHDAQAALTGASGNDTRFHALYARAWLALFRGDHRELAHILDDELESPEIPAHLLDMHFYLQARSAHLAGAFGRVWAMLDRVDLARCPTRIAAEVAGLRIEMLVSERRFAQADAEISALPPATAADGPVRLAVAKLLFQTARIGEARQVVSPLHASNSVWPRHRARAAVITAACHAAEGDADAARDGIRDVSWLAEGYPVSEPYDDAPEALLANMTPLPRPRKTSRPRLGDPRPRLEITRREQAVLHELVDETRIEAIAQRLHVSVNTVKSQLRMLYRKLDVHSREEALKAAAEQGLL